MVKPQQRLVKLRFVLNGGVSKNERQILLDRKRKLLQELAKIEKKLEVSH